MHGRPSGSPGARAALRAATRDVHERLHVSPWFLAISERRLSRAGYAELMGQLAATYFALASDLGLDPARMERLACDLADLDLPTPKPVVWRRPTSAAERLGWQYVVEGSIFGGQVIYRQLDYLFGHVEGGRRFFAGSPGGAGRWRELCEDLERAGAEQRGLEEMIAGARDAFAHFERQLARECIDG